MKKYHLIAINKKTISQFILSAFIALLIIYINMLYFSSITAAVQTSSGFFDMDIMEIFNFIND